MASGYHFGIFWLPLWYLPITTLVSSDYPFGIFKPFFEIRYEKINLVYKYIIANKYVTPPSCILYRYIMFGRGICEKYQSRDEKFPQPNGEGNLVWVFFGNTTP
jgi:hypothetical protein